MSSQIGTMCRRVLAERGRITVKPERTEAGKFCRPSRNSLGCHHNGVSWVLIWAIGSTSELHRGFPGINTTCQRRCWAS